MNAYTNATDTFVAADFADLLKCIDEHYGAGSAESEGWNDPGDWEVLPGDRVTTIVVDGVSKRETKTIAEWIADNGRGMLCSTEF